MGTILLYPDRPDDDYLGYHFEARICPLALASVVRAFDHDADVIQVLEEAQFQGRRVRVHRAEADRSIRIRLALTSDLGLEINPENLNASTHFDTKPSDVLIAFETAVKRIASEECRGNTSEAYEVYASRVSAAIDGLLEGLDPVNRDEAIRIAERYDYHSQAERDADYDPNACALTGIDIDYCHCGRHP